MEGLVLKDIILQYSGDEALNIPYLYSGGSLGITGLSGSGKSNLIKVICGLEYIKSGEIFIDGVEVGGLKPAKRGLALLSRHTPLMPNKTVYQNLAYPLKKHKFTQEQASKMAFETAEKANLNPLKRVRELNEWQQTDLLILRSAVRNPHYILIDEPIDFAPDAEYFLKRIKQLLPHQRLVLASYDFDALTHVAPTLLVLKKGQIAALGGLEDIKNSKDPFVQSLCRCN